MKLFKYQDEEEEELEEWEEEGEEEEEELEEEEWEEEWLISTFFNFLLILFFYIFQEYFPITKNFQNFKK